MLEFIYFTLLVDSELTPPSEVGKKVQFQELAITTAIILLALLLLYRLDQCTQKRVF